MLDGDDYLKATARRPVALVSAGTLTKLALTEGETVSVSGALGSVELPVAVADLPDGVVWAPASARCGAVGSPVRLGRVNGGAA
jgi:NADH-quinone oxidoreductase subunit G